LGRYEFKFDKLRIDLAFEHVWRDWPDRYKSQFSQVDTEPRNGTDAVWVMTYADEKKNQGWGNNNGAHVLQQRRRCGAGVGAIVAVADIVYRLPGELGC
jgi:hypothetical protein